MFVGSSTFLCHYRAAVELLLLSSDTPTETTLVVSKEPEIDPQFQLILSQFPDVFEDPVGLPPSRTCDHIIPLVPGAHPFTVRPYWYPPALKNEMEKQVREMLSHGVIQKSHNPFASPVLLIKKKDHTWHFCVDYRYLNAMIVKIKYPVPIFD